MRNKNIALFAGSFDPISKGHENIVLRALPLFDEIVIAIGSNTQKKHLFPIKQRLVWIQQTFAQYPNIKVDTYDCLTIDYCKQHNIKYLLRGIRNSEDFSYEQNIAQINKNLDSNIETIFIPALPQYFAISSSTIRELLTFKRDVSDYIPVAIKDNFKI